MSHAFKAIMKKQSDMLCKRGVVPLVQVNLGKMRYYNTRPSSQTNRTRCNSTRRDRSITLTKQGSRSQKDITLLKSKQQLNTSLKNTLVNITSSKENSLKGNMELTVCMDLSNDVISEAGINLVKEVRLACECRPCVSPRKISPAETPSDHTTV